MSGLGPIALHGGASLRAADPSFGRELLRLTGAAAARRADSCVPGSAAGDVTTRRIVIVSAEVGDGDLRRLADEARLLLGGTPEANGEPRAVEALRVDAVAFRDRAGTASGPRAALLAAADLVHLADGDPARLAATLRDTLAWNAILAARGRGAVLAGSGGGAEALGASIGGAGGGAGLAAVPRVRVIAGADGELELAARRHEARPDLAILLLSDPAALVSGETGPGGRAWRVVGEGRVRLLAPGIALVSAGPGETLALPA